MGLIALHSLSASDIVSASHMSEAHANDKAAVLVADAVVSVCTASKALGACLVLLGEVRRTCSAREPSIKLLKPLGWCPFSCLQPAGRSRHVPNEAVIQPHLATAVCNFCKSGQGDPVRRWQAGLLQDRNMHSSSRCAGMQGTRLLPCVRSANGQCSTNSLQACQACLPLNVKPKPSLQPKYPVHESANTSINA